MINAIHYLGIDLGSTTVKYALLDASGQLLAQNYVRHQSAVVDTLINELQALSAKLIAQDSSTDLDSILLKINFTGSAALDLSRALHANFVQEVIAASTYLKSFPEKVDVAIELGGEDGKIIFLTNGVELRMNEACAGGTGAFADQMATLLSVSTSELNTLASQAQKIHPIASRCGVFAKTDVVALLNQGVPRSEIAKSVFAAICEQTISGLACGRPIVGNVCFLGGPLSFLTELKQSFIHKLSSPDVHFIELNNSQYAIALGAAYALRQDEQEHSVLNPGHTSSQVITLPELIRALQNCKLSSKPQGLPPLFEDLAQRNLNPVDSDAANLASDAANPAAATLARAAAQDKTAVDANSAESSAITLFEAAEPAANTQAPTASLADAAIAGSTLSSQSAIVIAEDGANSVVQESYGVHETYEQFKARHALASVETKPLDSATGPLFLGVDLGSTTIKLVLLNAQQEMLESYYAPNGGAPLKFLLPKVQELLGKIPNTAYLAAICTTGYGADLAKAALNAQFSEVETLAHQRAAVAFDPEVSYVIDIGGQDMKCIQVSQGVITSIQLNEACSSGCGSFLETFAAQLNLPLAEFVKQSLQAAAPCDLGTRCTVFMNSKVKQAQRDNIPIGDIAAGLCLSIVRNALYKVLRIHDSAQLGEHVVVQGGTFLNDAILRAFELNIGRDVIRPNIAGLMGAFGAALLAQERCQHPEKAMSFAPELFDLSKIKTRAFRCKGCNNHCALTMNTFLSGQKYMQGNRCDFALKNADKAKNSESNFCDFKNQLLFERPVLLTVEQAQSGNAQNKAELSAAKAHAISLNHHATNMATSPEGEAPVKSSDSAAAKAARAAALLQKARAAQKLHAAAMQAQASKLPAETANAALETETTEAKAAKTQSIEDQTQTAQVKAAKTQRSELGLYADKTNYLPVEQGVATRGVIGIPRVLNMFEHYPFWHALFTALHFSVRLSPQSNAAILALGNQSIPSQSLCLPAKLAHGHITYLAEHGVERIFLPCVTRETKQDYFTENDEYFACPVVGGYPEALRLNLQSTFPELKLYTPFLMLNTVKRIVETVQEIDPSIKASEIKAAISLAQSAQAQYKEQLKQHASEQIERAQRENLPLMVLAGHPYHIDPFINHGIPALLSSMGTCLVTEDAIAPLAKAEPELEVVNQWAFHSRLYRAAQFVIEHPKSELVQLVSFGCGIDAITSEQVKKLLQRHQRLYTMLKIDEGDTLGAAKIRLRSLLCATQKPQIAYQYLESAPNTAAGTSSTQVTAEPTQDGSRALCTTQDIGGCVPEQAAASTMPLSQALAGQTLENRTLYMPQMAPVHFPILASCLKSLGYNVQLLEDVSESDIEQGLKYINNDACYPAIVAIGQLLNPLIQSKIDPQHSALLLAQTCGSCRATNYTALLEWALQDLHSNVPIVTLQGSTLNDSHLHLKLGLSGLKRLIKGLLYGDLLQHLYLHTKTYEEQPGEAERLLKHYQSYISADLLKKRHNFKRLCQQIIQDFAKIKLRQEQRPKVGIVGEILLKYHPVANNHVVERIIAEGGEPVLGDITAFVLYCLHGNVYQAQAFGIDKLKGVFTWFIVKHFDHLRNILIKLLSTSPFAELPAFKELLEYGQRFTTWGQQAGEGWLLEAEMLDFIEHDVPNILCVQPFACLPNHITGKGLMRTMREHYPQANLCSLDFEAGTTQSNVVNRLKLFMSQAKHNLLSNTAPLHYQMAQTQAQTAQEPSSNTLVNPAVSAANADTVTLATAKIGAGSLKLQSPDQAAATADAAAASFADAPQNETSEAALTQDAGNTVEPVVPATPISGAASAAKATIGEMADSVADSVADAVADVASHAKAAKATAVEAAKNASNTVVNAASYAADAAKSASSTVRNAANAAAHAADLVVDAKNHVVEVASYAQDAVADVANKAAQVSSKLER